MKVETDFRDVKIALGAFSDQAPFATANALTQTAKDCKLVLGEADWPRSVNVRNKGFFKRAVWYKRAEKHNLTAVVGVFKRKPAGFGKGQETVSAGGIATINRLIKGSPHFPYRGRYLAIPVRDEGIKLVTKTGKLNKKGRAILARNHPNTFVADLRGKGPAIWERTRNGIKLLFILKPKVDTPKKFDLVRSVRKVVKAVWNRHIDKSMRHAIRTAFR